MCFLVFVVILFVAPGYLVNRLVGFAVVQVVGLCGWVWCCWLIAFVVFVCF